VTAEAGDAAPNDAALSELLAALARRGYAFVTPTPATHARVVARPDRAQARDLAGVLGWNLPFSLEEFDGELVELLERADALVPAPGGLMRATVRVSWLEGRLYLHSGYPTEAADAVFFGPDSYRFARLITDELTGRSAGVRRIVDIGAGAGVGAITAAALCPQAKALGTDINPQALRYARINSAHAGIALETALGSGLDPLEGRFDLVLANPPYIADDGRRQYRDGGGMIGGELSLRMAQAALPRLNPGGRMILYTGSAVVDGRDALGKGLAELAQARGHALSYRELDPDVFGEELAEPAYRTVDRIAVVAAVFTAPR
jgi:methylase of polypeptide subunit release factors